MDQTNLSYRLSFKIKGLPIFFSSSLRKALIYSLKQVPAGNTTARPFWSVTKSLARKKWHQISKMFHFKHNLGSRWPTSSVSKRGARFSIPLRRPSNPDLQATKVSPQKMCPLQPSEENTSFLSRDPNWLGVIFMAIAIPHS